MKQATGIALSMGAGYVLGRRRKLRAAMLLGAVAASGRVGKALQGTSAGSGGPLGQLRSAAQGAVRKPLDALGERLTGTAQAMREGGGTDGTPEGGGADGTPEAGGGQRDRSPDRDREKSSVGGG